MARQVQSVGARIKAIREEKQMTQQDVAKLLGISRAAIAQWENDTTSPSIQTVAEVAKILEATPQWLAFGISLEPKIVFKDPEGSTALPEVTWGDKVSDMTKVRSWSVPSEYLKTELNCQSTQGLVIWRVESPNMAPTYDYGDKVIVDTNAKRPGSGVFLIWDGVGPSLNMLSVAPNAKGVMSVKIASTATGESYEIAVDKIQIIGRVRGLLKSV